MGLARLFPSFFVAFALVCASGSGLGTAHAVTRGCSTILDAYISPGEDLHRVDVKLYKDAQSVLFLTDIEEKFPVRATMHYDRFGRFIMIGITPSH